MFTLTVQVVNQFRVTGPLSCHWQMRQTSGQFSRCTKINHLVLIVTGYRFECLGLERMVPWLLFRL